MHNRKKLAMCIAAAALLLAIGHGPLTAHPAEPAETGAVRAARNEGVARDASAGLPGLSLVSLGAPPRAQEPPVAQEPPSQTQAPADGREALATVAAVAFSQYEYTAGELDNMLGTPGQATYGGMAWRVSGDVTVTGKVRDGLVEGLSVHAPEGYFIDNGTAFDYARIMEMAESGRLHAVADLIEACGGAPPLVSYWEGGPDGPGKYGLVWRADSFFVTADLCAATDEAEVRAGYVLG